MTQNPGTILIVEDEKNLGITLQEYLQDMGHESLLARTGAEAKYLFDQHSPNIVLMDIGLPDTNGLDLARYFREIRKDFVLLFLSALNDPDTKVEGLEIGAEDYITKPFALKELVLRLERISKFQTANQAYPDEIEIGALKIWFKRYEVQDANGKIIPLSQKEYGILEMLYSQKNQAVPRDQIIEKIWGEDKFPTNRTVDNYIVKLRKWCESDNNKPLEIASVRGVGYKLILNN
jgi:DNA-binding response OmpR family regulator